MPCRVLPVRNFVTALVIAFFLLFPDGLRRAADATPNPTGAPQTALSPEQRAADFDQLWEYVRDHYCYLGEKATDWNAVRDRYRPLAIEAADKRAFIAVLEATLDELYDPHTHLGVNLASSWRLPPYDLWVERRGAKAVIVEVRRSSAAEQAGAVAGMEIVEVDGTPLEQALALRRPKCLRRPDREAEEWALRSLVAGRRDRARDLLVVGRDGRRRRLRFDDLSPTSATSKPLLSFRRLPGALGYIHIASFGDEGAIEEFDRALEALRSTRAIVVDVRDNPGGDTAVARPIMGRLISRPSQYAWMARREGDTLGKRWPEYVDPRGPWTYRGRVVVLVNHWSESMAEGFAMGLDGMKRATVVGTPMSGLGAGISRTILDHSGISVQISAEPVFHVRGTPRTAFRPSVPVDLRSSGPGDDPILEAALRHLRTRRRAG